ncbi:hypothetical protein MtrunA17_Chr6g0474561 [Medicago truncatula]|uniref:Transmembrane protein n=1 Tax=Medicago truncatula TaxID=3880 RepID=A0A396HH61_MEDTR|nr:hypothetical protein MtrunA17_Chr6g0474561 [Medicago truncatula]
MWFVESWAEAAFEGLDLVFLFRRAAYQQRFPAFAAAVVWFCYRVCFVRLPV